MEEKRRNRRTKTFGNIGFSTDIVNGRYIYSEKGRGEEREKKRENSESFFPSIITVVYTYVYITNAHDRTCIRSLPVRLLSLYVAVHALSFI